MFILYKNIPK